MPVSMQTRISMPKLPTRERPGGVPRTQTERLWLIGGGLAAFVMVLIGYFFFISPERSHTNDVRLQIADAKQQNTVLQARIDALRIQDKDLARYEAEFAQARLALPTTSGISDFVRTLQALGNATQTDVTSLSVAAPISMSSLSASQPSSGTGAEEANAAATTTAPGPAQPTPGQTTSTAVGGVYGLPITATVSGSPASLEQFLNQLQAVQPRAVLITQITQTVGTTGNGASGASGQTILSLTMEAFVAPASPVEGASLSAAAAPSPSPSSTTH